MSGLLLGRFCLLLVNQIRMREKKNMLISGVDLSLKWSMSGEFCQADNPLLLRRGINYDIPVFGNLYKRERESSFHIIFKLLTYFILLLLLILF